MTRYTIVDSPVGALLLARDGDGLRALHFLRGRRPADPDPAWTRDDAGFDDLARELHEYFAGTRREFTVPLAPRGTGFQRAVWAELCRIPYGETISYAELARRIGNPRAVRAVGLANGANPLAIIVPCHRVIGADGTLTGYGGGLTTKRYLLDLERDGAATSRADLFAAAGL
jgi:methylated-DNA-[protein]-cysteine S-methyltransferase